MNYKKIAGVALRILAAAILLQTLRFKFSAHPESVALFTKLGAEPWGRIATGIAELVAGILLLVRPTAVWGAIMSAGIMAGAIGSHLFVIGIESAGDGGQLFILACTVLVASVLILVIYRQDLKKSRFLPEFLRRLV